MATYSLTFFPLHNAFAISPAPAFDVQLADQDFNWKFADNDEIKVYCNPPAQEQKIKFTRKPVDGGTRFDPVDGLENCVSHDQDENIPAGEIWKSNNEDPDSFFKFVIDQAGRDAMVRWQFDFECKIGDDVYVVDPEIGIDPGH